MKRLVFHLLFFLPLMAAAQGPWNDPPRVEDHFHRRRILNSIDLREKINRPFVVTAENAMSRRGGTTTGIYANESADFGNRRGLVQALLDGLKDLKYPGYSADTLDVPTTYDDLMRRLRALATVSGQPATDGGTAAPAETDGGGGGDDFGGDEFGMGEDDFGFGDDFGGGDDFGAGGDLDQPATEVVDNAMQDVLAGLNFRMGLLEDRIFDKNKSDMYFDLHYIVLYWIDPQGTLPEMPLVAIKYEDALDVLSDTQWKNFYNDAENRSMQEVFEQRLFHSYIINVSGNNMMSLNEAEKRHQQLVEYEHHLWEF